MGTKGVGTWAVERGIVSAVLCACVLQAYAQSGVRGIRVPELACVRGNTDTELANRGGHLSFPALRYRVFPIAGCCLPSSFWLLGMGSS